MNHLLLSVALAVMSALETPATLNAPVSDTAIQAVAARALPSFLANIPASREALYGFGDRGQFARAKVGRPIPVWEAPVEADSPLVREDSSWRPQARGSWRVPVLVDGRARVFLTVESTATGLEAVDFGGAELAQEIATVEAQHPISRKALLRLDRLGCDILVFDPEGKGFAEGKYHPLRSAKSVFPGDSTIFQSRRNLGRAVRRHQAEIRRGER